MIGMWIVCLDQMHEPARLELCDAGDTEGILFDGFRGFRSGLEWDVMPGSRRGQKVLCVGEW
jgi:hypothetical protein